MTKSQRWPSLAVDSWVDTQATLQMWLQIVGKIELVSTPLINHWWNVAYEVSARGLRTRLMWGPESQFDAEFDFVNGQLGLRVTDGSSRTVALAPKTVAQFYSEVNKALGELGLQVPIQAAPNEVSPAVPFAEDTQHKSYDAAAVQTWWRQNLASNRVFSQWAAGFAGKQSPVQLFWGSMDLSAVRFSGKPAPAFTGTPPPNCPAWVMAEAESQQCAAVGFWAGGSEEGSFYAYANPSPAGYADASLTVGQFDKDMGEFLLPYKDVRTSSAPEETLLTFLQETYSVAADLGSWDRTLLDIDPHRLDPQLYGPEGGGARAPLV